MVGTKTAAEAAAAAAVRGSLDDIDINLAIPATEVLEGAETECWLFGFFAVSPFSVEGKK